MLTDKQIKALKPQDRPYKLADGGGLSLLVTPAGGFLWVLKFRHGGKEKKLSLGPYPVVTLGDARKRREEARRMLAQGLDPAAAKQAAKASSKAQDGPTAPSFVQVFEAWLVWRGKALIARTQASINSAVRRHVLPTLGGVEMDKITPLQIKAAVAQVDDLGHHDLARRLFQRIHAVFRYGITHGLCTNDPTATIRPAEIFVEQRVEHRKYLPVNELPDLFTKMADYTGSPVVIKGSSSFCVEEGCDNGSWSEPVDIWARRPGRLVHMPTGSGLI